MNDESSNRRTGKISTPKDFNRGRVFFVFIIFVIIAALGIGFVAFSNHERTQPAATVPAAFSQSGVLPGIQTGDAPWEAELINLRERLTIMGLPILHEEGSAVHIHQHLDVFIHGKKTDIPSGIGFNPMERFIAPVHTHDGNGVIHIESPTVQKFTLGQFIDIWGVRLDSKCIGSYCEDQKNFIKVFVNGVVQDGDPRLIELSDHQIIAIFYGENNELPNPIPSQYQFPQGT